MFENRSPAWHARADQLLEAAIDATMEMASTVDELDEGEAVFMLCQTIIATGIPRETLAQAVAGLSVRMRRLSSREPVPSPE